jgi:aryl-alcohol dehydrogenase-like predicted oxidoreductase
MKYRRLGRTNLKVSVVGVGTWQFGGEWGKNFTQYEADRILGRARERGINLIDTAECYGDHASEAFIGRAIAGGRREDWVLATKFGHHFKTFLDRDTVYDPADVVAQLEASLRALRTDYVDLYQFHSGNDEQFDTPGLWDAMQQQQRAGKIRHLGISISSNGDRTRQVDSATGVGAAAIQVVYNRLERGAEERVLPSCASQDLGVLARVPLASGYLSGKYKPGDAFGRGDVRSTHDRAKTDAKLREAEQIRQAEVPPGVEMPQWALAWCLKHPAVSCVIPGCKNVDQVDGNAAAADLEMLAEDHPQAWREEVRR